MLRALNLENVNEDFKKLNSLNRDYGLALFFLDKKISDDEMYRNMDMFRSKLGKKRKGSQKEEMPGTDQGKKS